MKATEHDRASELLGAWALDACTGTEHALVEAHRAWCDDCGTEAEMLLRSATDLGASLQPPSGLRDTVLRAARTARRAPAVVVAEPYAAEVGKLDRLLATLTAEQWRTAVIHGWTVRDLVAHLAAGDGVLAAHFGLHPAVPPGGPEPALVHGAWRAQAGALTRHVVGAGTRSATALVDYAGSRWPPHLVLVARAFETWIHADDIRAVLGLPHDPPVPAHLFLFTRAVMQLLPDILMATGIDSPGYVRFELGGRGGGAWDLPLGTGRDRQRPRTPPTATVTMDVLDFCYLAGGRRDLELVEHRITGDAKVATRVLAVAASLDRD